MIYIKLKNFQAVSSTGLYHQFDYDSVIIIKEMLKLPTLDPLMIRSLVIEYQNN